MDRAARLGPDKGGTRIASGLPACAQLLPSLAALWQLHPTSPGNFAHKPAPHGALLGFLFFSFLLGSSCFSLAAVTNTQERQQIIDGAPWQEKHVAKASFTS